jgi:hypothetical protein
MHLIGAASGDLWLRQGRVLLKVGNIIFLLCRFSSRVPCEQDLVVPWLRGHGFTALAAQMHLTSVSLPTT